MILYPLSIWLFYQKRVVWGVSFFIFTAASLVISAALSMPQIYYESVMMIPISLSAFLYLENKKFANGFFFAICSLGMIMLTLETYVEKPSIPEGNYILYNQVLIMMFFVVMFTKLISLVVLFRKIITDSEINTQNLIQSEIARRKSEVQYYSLFENNLYGIVLVDTETRFLDFNQAFVEMMGYSREELKNQSVIAITDPEALPASIAFFEKLARKEISSFYHEKKYIRKNGEKFNAIAAVRGLYDESGNFLGGIATVQDITEKVLQRKIIQQQIDDLNGKNRELQKYITSNLELENFAYIASHDLQAPIRSIISFTQLLKKMMGNKLSPEEEEYMGFIISASRNMHELIRDLLTFSRVNTSKIRLDEINLGKIITGIKQELKPVIEEKQVVITVTECPKNLIADKTKIYQLFQNLLTNAIKFQVKGTPPEIHISCEERNSDWLFCVRDNGIGIAEEYHEKIFLLFRRLHNSHRYEGTGIGLALCKKIVSQHNGRIWVESTLGNGSQFFFTIAKQIVTDEQT
ncbi:MAG: ATP-binding protein [Bacteroidia bacterium]|nr:ATP-binding protein [Bacteroidia bacterium]